MFRKKRINMEFSRGIKVKDVAIKIGSLLSDEWEEVASKVIGMP